MATLGEPQADFLPSEKNKFLIKQYKFYYKFLSGIAKIQIEIGVRIGVPNRVGCSLFCSLFCCPTSETPSKKRSCLESR